MMRVVHLSLMLVGAIGAAAAQQPQGAATKPTLTNAEYAKWESLGAGQLSPDGKWLAYDFRRGNQSVELRYRAVDSGSETAVPSGSAPQFTSNSHWLVYTLTPDTAGGRGGRGGAGRGGRGGQAAPGAPATPNRNKVVAVDLRTGRASTFDDVQTFSLSNDGAHIALRRYGTPGRRAADIIVHDFDAGTDLTFGNVSEFSWNESGSLLAMIVDVEGHTGNGVQLLNAQTSAIRSLDAGDMHYTGLVWHSKGDNLAALRSRVDSAFADTSYTIMAWRGLSASPSKLAYDFGTDASFPKGLRVASYRAPQWSEDGSTIIFGLALREPKVTPDRRAPGELPPARVQVWHWKDLREFHQQEVQGAQDRTRTTPASWRVGSSTIARLSDDPYETVQIGESGTALASDENPYVREVMSGRQYRDVYRVDVATGKRDKILTKSAFGATLSPSGRYATYEQDGNWWLLDVSSGTRTNLTGKIKSAFVNMEDDHPVAERRAYGIAGFTTGEKSLVVYDRFDLWQVNVDGSSPVRLTRGKEDSTVYRCASEGGSGGRGGGRGRGGAGAAGGSAPCSLDGEGRTIDTSKPLMLTATGEYNKKSGYSKITIGQPAERLVWADKQVSGLRKADNANVFLYEQQTYEESPNYFVAASTLASAKQVSNTNAFQSEYAWGKQVLMPYTNKRGDKLQMMLTYPANYEPGKKYPMVVYYYEKLSQGFHQYVVPSDRSTYNTSVFSQNGYFVLRPDIVFQARNPGYSGLDCVTSAVAAALSKVSDIDPKRVGNMGHSWGGYQSAFYAVHGHGVFAATIAGAPLTDLISFYGYTSGNSGLPETGHFETGQERMQVSLWEDPQAYIRNSTVFAMDSLQTPLLLEEGDIDGNVNPFQSQEVYNFGRRLGKNVVYLVYEQENHGVARPESQADYARRQLEWFAHYLKGEPAASWITDGESYQTRQKILKDGPGAIVPTQAGVPRP
jgi:dienelactone hydrolase